jgi:large subunit ribosomal protein L4
MLKVDLYTVNSTKSGQIELPKEIFGAKINQPLMAQAVRVYLSNQRQALARVQTRSEVNRTKAKWFRQKGTGRARHGARSAPIFVGGGKAHGSTGEQNYCLKMSKAMKKKALFSALTSKFESDDILVIKGLEKIEPKTKNMTKIIKNLKISRGAGSGSARKNSKLTLILPQKLDNVTRAARNIPKVNLIQAALLNTYEVLNGGKLIFMKESIDKLKQTFLV